MSGDRMVTRDESRVIQDRRGQWMLMAVMAAAMFLDGMDGTIVNVVLPEISDSFGIDAGVTSWVVTVYFLMMAGLILIFGKVADGGAIKRVFVGGMAVFAISSLLCGLSTTLPMLLAFRAVQGVGAAMLAVSAFMLCVKFLPKSMAAFAMSVGILGMSIGAAMGPAIGGVLSEMMSWHLVFFINVPIGAFAILLAMKAVPGDGEFTAKGFDVKGAALLFVSMVCGLYVLESAPSHGFDGVSVVCLAVFVAGMAMFVLVERRAVDPVLKLRLFRLPRLLATIVTMVIINMCYMGCIYLIPYYLQVELGMDSISSGAYLLIPAVSTLAFCVWIGRLADKYGNRPFAVIACVVMLASMLVFAFIDPDAVWMLILGLVCMGVMWGIGGGPVSSRMLENVPDEDRPSSSSLNSFFIYFGCAAGTAMFAGLFGMGSGSSGQDIAGLTGEVFLEGFHFAMVFGVVLSVVALVLSWVVNERKASRGDGE